MSLSLPNDATQLMLTRSPKGTLSDGVRTRNSRESWCAAPDRGDQAAIVQSSTSDEQRRVTSGVVWCTREGRLSLAVRAGAAFRCRVPCDLLAQLARPLTQCRAALCRINTPGCGGMCTAKK